MEENKYSNDLTSVMAPFMDVHMMSPLLDFLREARYI